MGLTDEGIMEVPGVPSRWVQLLAIPRRRRCITASTRNVPRWFRESERFSDMTSEV
jgi:hypothetical protein